MVKLIFYSFSQWIFAKSMTNSQRKKADWRNFTIKDPKMPSSSWNSGLISIPISRTKQGRFMLLQASEFCGHYFRSISARVATNETMRIFVLNRWIHFFQVRKRWKHDNHMFHQSLLFRETSGWESGDRVSSLWKWTLRLSDPAFAHVWIHDQFHPQTQTPPWEVHDEQRSWKLYYFTG